MHARVRSVILWCQVRCGADRCGVWQAYIDTLEGKAYFTKLALQLLAKDQDKKRKDDYATAVQLLGGGFDASTTPHSRSRTHSTGQARARVDYSKETSTVAGVCVHVIAETLGLGCRLTRDTPPYRRSERNWRPRKPSERQHCRRRRQCCLPNWSAARV